MEEWLPDSWRSKPAAHLPEYADEQHLKSVECKLRKYPPLVFAEEAFRLKKSLGDVCNGKAFLLQGGDCAATAGRGIAGKRQAGGVNGYHQAGRREYG